ncbi:uncharacterized protein LOC123523924 [Mercenaria mercenaria]|uniref:uncharacterized protein LOC123523924 n=1 Tax=Mercenaria mercenaria TaxID=6596 RepID=UPI00234E8C0C|nr:uncharacterized protein LOC123523924 [Mercenaria mercenaria]
MADFTKEKHFAELAADNGPKRKIVDDTALQYSVKKPRTCGVQKKGYDISGCNEEPQRNPGFPATDGSVAIAYSANGNTTAGFPTGTSGSVALVYSSLGNTTAASFRLDDEDQELRDEDQEMRDEDQEMKDKHLE